MCIRDRFNPKERKRKKDFTKAMGYGQARGGGRVAKHKCAICGRTELDDPNLEFRFCSKCNGNYEYCQNHLFTHEMCIRDSSKALMTVLFISGTPSVFEV